MKKLLIVLFLTPLFAFSQTVVDSYEESNYSGNQTLYSGLYTFYAQSFIVINECNLSEVKFYIQKSGSPTGNITAYIYAHSGTYGTSSAPTGSPLATSNYIDISTISTSYSLHSFTFDGANAINLSSSTYYCVVIGYPGGDASNYLMVGVDSNSPTHSGNRARSVTGDSWITSSAVDAIFYVYATFGYTHKVCGISPSSISKISGVEATSIQKVQGVSK